MKNSEQNFLPLHLAAPCKKLPVLMTLSQRFFNHKQASRRSITAAKEKRRKRKGEKKFQKSKSLKTQVTFSSKNYLKNFDFCTCQSHNTLKRDAGGKKGKLLCCKHSICFNCVYCVTLQVQCYPCKSCEPEELKDCVNENHTMFHCQDVQKDQVKVKKVSNTKWISPEYKLCLYTTP